MAPKWSMVFNNNLIKAFPRCVGVLFIGNMKSCRGIPMEPEENDKTIHMKGSSTRMIIEV